MADTRTIQTPKGPVQATVYWDTSDPNDVGWAYRIHYPNGHEESGPCDTGGDPWDVVYDFLGVEQP